MGTEFYGKFDHYDDNDDDNDVRLRTLDMSISNLWSSLE